MYFEWHTKDGKYCSLELEACVVGIAVGSGGELRKDRRFMTRHNEIIIMMVKII